MKKMTANFYPAAEPKNGYIGKADITISNAIRLNGISVFQKPDEKGIRISFPGFGEGENTKSYVVPKSKEAHAAMREVVEMAVDSEKHFGYNQGDYGVRLEVSGNLVNEPYADGRFSCEVGDVCTLYGITTRPVTYEKEGKTHSFTAVDMPSIGSYESQNGEKQYRNAFEGRQSSWTTKEGNEVHRDYAQLLSGLIRGERKAKMKEKEQGKDQGKEGSLAEKISAADERKVEHAQKEAPTKESAMAK